MYARAKCVWLQYFFQSSLKITTLSLQHVNVKNSRNGKKGNQIVFTLASAFVSNLPRLLIFQFSRSVCGNDTAWQLEQLNDK